MQAGSSRDRGIGRYASALVGAMAAFDLANHYVLYDSPDHPGSPIPAGPRVERRTYPTPPDDPTAIQRAVRGNPDKLDLLLLTSTHHSRVVGRCGVPQVAAVLYDLIPERSPEIYFADERYRQGYERYLEEIQGYDLYLAISECTRRDFIERRDFPAERIITLPPAVDHARFRPVAASTPFPASLTALGIARPYVLHVGGMDPRKGGGELIEAFGRLPRTLRDSHQLVFAYSQSERYQTDRLRQAAAQGVRLVMTGYVPEEVLIALYQHAELMAFPSKAEGLGMPVLEALACATPIVAGDNTSLPELVGAAGLLTDVTQVGSISRAIEHLLSDPRRRSLLSHAGARRVRAFTWEQTARTVLEAVRRLPRPLAPAASAETSGAPELALFSCFPPVLSGISGYAVDLARALSSRYRVTLFHDPSRRPELPSELVVEVRSCDEFDPLRWRRRLYQVGNSEYHAFLLGTIAEAPGVVTVHDLNLAGLWQWAREPGRTDVSASSASSAGALLAQVCATSRIVVHDPSNRDQIARQCPAGVYVIPFGARPNVLGADRKAAVRAACGLDPTAPLLAFGGLIHESKLAQESLIAFAACRPEGWSMAFIGPEIDRGAARRLALALEIPDVHFVGPLPSHEFADLLASADLVVNLRRPPTNGETSGALFDALRGGVATIVSDVGTFRSLPDDCVRKTPPDDLAEIVLAIRELTRDETARRALGARALARVREHHGWDRIALRYADAIEGGPAHSVSS